MATDMAERRVELLADGMHFPEGPRWYDGHLYLSDFFDCVVRRFKPDGSYEVLCEVPGQPSGLGFLPNGDLLISSMNDRRLLRLADGELSVVAELGDYIPAPCNDLFVDPGCRVYLGNFGSELQLYDEPIQPTVLVRVDPDGSVHVAAEDLIFPNGMVLTPDGSFVVAETFAFRISAFDVARDGSLINRRLWAKFGDEPAADINAVLASEPITPDGMCGDAEGGIWIADAHGNGALRVVEGGEITDRIELDGLTAYAVALGGEDGRTLFMAANPRLGEVEPDKERKGVLLSTRVDVPGIGWA